MCIKNNGTSFELMIYGKIVIEESLDMNYHSK